MAKTIAQLKVGDIAYFLTYRTDRETHSKKVNHIKRAIFAKIEPAIDVSDHSWLYVRCCDRRVSLYVANNGSSFSYHTCAFCTDEETMRKFLAESFKSCNKEERKLRPVAIQLELF